MLKDIFESITFPIKSDTQMTNILAEATRKEIVSNSKAGLNYKDKKTNRWEAKKQCEVAATVKDYNKIDMDTFWKQDKLIFNVKVKGASDSYNVTIVLKNVVDNLQKNVKANDNLITKKEIYRALLDSLNKGDLEVNCDCPDFQNRFAYIASKNHYKAGQQETRPADKTNPNNDLGMACKHVLCVINNAQWLQKITSVINNYINYCKDKLENSYSKYIFPKIYGMTYNKAVQLTVDDFDENGNLKDKLDTDEATINLANALGKLRGRIKPGSNKNPAKTKK